MEYGYGNDIYVERNATILLFPDTAYAIETTRTRDYPGRVKNKRKREPETVTTYRRDINEREAVGGKRYLTFQRL